LERHQRRIQKRAVKFDIDDEAKASLVEALEAHQNGHYRAVCRPLLPEIERAARVELAHLTPAAFGKMTGLQR
jgi:hypothetical protein